VSADRDPERAEHPHARRRPGLVALVYAYRALAGLVIALPAAVALGGATAWYPRGQTELFGAGSVMLIESLRLGRRAYAPVTWSAGAVATLALVGGLLPLGALLAGLGRRGRVSVAFLAGRAWGHAGTLALVSVLGLLAQGAVFALVLELGSKVVQALKLGLPGDDLASAGLVAFAALVAMVLGVVRDLAVAAAVRDDLRFYDATARALRCARRAGGRVLLAWTWRSLLGFAGLVAAVVAASYLPVAPAAAVVASVALHQAGIAGTTFAHASWLAAAMRYLDATAPASWRKPESVPPPAPAPSADTPPVESAAPATETEAAPVDSEAAPEASEPVTHPDAPEAEGEPTPA
jgi:hypothetical protein